jgi:hypothetical protein
MSQILIVVGSASAVTCGVFGPSRVPERDQPVTEIEPRPDAEAPVHEAPPPRYGDRVAAVRDGALD